jgi:hypothetical protein
MRYRATLIVTIMVVLSGLCLASWGWIEGDGLHFDKPDHGAALIGGGILCFLSGLFLLSALSNFRRARAVRTNPEGEFHVPADAMAAFFKADSKQEEPNEWRPPFWEKRKGVDIAWAGDTLLVGGHLWGFAPEHYPSIYGIELHLRPLPHVVVRYSQFWIDPLKSHNYFHNTHRTFRFPVTDQTAARALVRHFLDILATPRLKRSRRNARLARIVMATAGVLCIVVGGYFFGQTLYAQAQGQYLSEGQRALAIAGAVFAIMGGPVFLGMAWILRDK